MQYVHSSPPQPVKYREECNIMYDRRVVRGNTYAAQVVTQNAQREVERLREEAERTTRREARRRRLESLKPSTPPPVEGRGHMEAQTEEYVELADTSLETDAQVQTEHDLDYDPEPLFVPSKTGHDKETEIPVGELFDFDFEVTPILEVLVGKTLKIAMIEVMEEEELANIQRHQDEFEEMRNAEALEVQRLDAEASRRFAEKQRRVAQEDNRKQQQFELAEKIAARSFAKNYFADLSSFVFDQLEDEGHFVDPVIHEVTDLFLPSLFDKVTDRVDAHHLSLQLADDLIHSALDIKLNALQTSP